MQILIVIMSLLVNYSIVLFLIALACGFIYSSAYNQRNFRRARRAATASFAASSLLAAVYLAITLVGGGGALNIIMVAAWGYFAYRDYKFLKMCPK